MKRLLAALIAAAISSQLVGCDPNLNRVKRPRVTVELSVVELEELYFQTFAESLEEAIINGASGLTAGADAALDAQKAVKRQGVSFNPIEDIDNLFTKQEKIIKEVYEGVNNRESSRDSD